MTDPARLVREQKRILGRHFHPAPAGPVAVRDYVPPLPLKAWRMAAPLGEPRPVHGSQPGPAL